MARPYVKHAQFDSFRLYEKINKPIVIKIMDNPTMPCRQHGVHHDKHLKIHYSDSVSTKIILQNYFSKGQVIFHTKQDSKLLPLEEC